MYDYYKIGEALLWRAIYFKLVFDENYPIFLLMLADQFVVLTVAVEQRWIFFNINCCMVTIINDPLLSLPCRKRVTNFGKLAHRFAHII